MIRPHLISQSVCLPTYRPSSVLFRGGEGAAVVLLWFPPRPFIWKMWLKERMGLTLANGTAHRFCHCCFFALHLLFLSRVDLVRGGCDERISCFWCNPCRIDSNLPPLMSSRIYYKQMLAGVRLSLLVSISFLNKGIVLPEERRCVWKFKSKIYSGCLMKITFWSCQNVAVVFTLLFYYNTYRGWNKNNTVAECIRQPGSTM